MDIADHNQDSEEGGEDVPIQRMPRRVIRNRMDPFEMSDRLFRIMFAFKKDQVRIIYDHFRADLEQRGRPAMATGLSGMQRLLMFLSYVHSGEYFRCIGSQHHVQTSTSSIGCESCSNHRGRS